MPVNKIIIIVVAIVVVAVILLVAALAFVIVRIPFSSRCDKNPLLKYFTAADFSLSAKPVEVNYVKTKKKALHLRGYLYKKEGVEQNGKLVIFCHGMGPGQIAYTTEIACFCNLGFAVLALDYTGCNFSDGKNIVGFHSGVLATEAAIDYADEELDYEKIYLVGHSWGGYSALCASKTRQVEGVVAISAPDSPARTLYLGAKAQLPSFIVALAYPFIKLFLSGKNLSAAQCAQYANAPVLLIHGEKDPVVPKINAVYYRAFGDNIVKYLSDGKLHNPYNTVEAEEQLSKLSAKLAEARKTRNPDRKFFNEFDFSAATEEDVEVMSAIADFLSEN